MRIQSWLVWSTILALVAACGSDDAAPNDGLTLDAGASNSDAGQEPDSGGDPDARTASKLAGVWSVTRAPTGTFGTTGAMTLRFPSERSGLARFLGKDAASGITTCGNYVFAVVEDGVVVLESNTLPRGAFVIGQPDSNTITLTSDNELLTLSRVSGPPPVEECGSADTTIMAQWDNLALGSWSRLSAVDDVLYFNTNESGEPIASYSLASKALGAKRTYTVSANGGVDRWAIAAASHDVFFGHCGCGGSTYLSRFNAATNERILSVDTTTLGAQIGVRFGERHGADIVVGGRGGDNVTRNVLLTLDPTTLQLGSQRSILSTASVEDITYQDETLYALTDSGSIIQVAADGTAARTHDIPALRGLDPAGLAAAGGKFYVIARSSPAGTTLLELTLK